MIETKKLAPCPDCGGELSPRALFCPGRGRVLAQELEVRLDVVELLEQVNAALAKMAAERSAAEVRRRVLRRLIGMPAAVATTRAASPRERPSSSRFTNTSGESGRSRIRKGGGDEPDEN